MTLGGTSKDVPRAQMRRPRRLILDDHEPTERCEVLTNGVIRQRSVRSPNVLGQRCRGGVRGDVASEASEQLLDFRWVVSSAVNARDVDAANLVEVVADCPQRLGDRQMAESWPPADGDLLRQFGDCETRIGTSRRFAGKKLGEGNRPAASTDLEEGHRTHPESGNPPGARVSRDVVRGNSRPGEDELAGSPPIVDGTTDVVPDLWLDLPFVDETGRRSLEHERRIDGDRLSCVQVGVEQYLAGSDLSCGGCLATRLRAFDHHCSGGAEPNQELIINDPGTVRRLHQGYCRDLRRDIVEIEEGTL